MKTTTEINEKMAYHLEELALLCRQLAQPTMTGDEVVVQPPPRETSDEGKPLWEHRYKLAPGYDGKLALLIKAMYEEGMFLKEDGNFATSVEDVARYIGSTLGENYHDWRQTLRGAVLPKCALNFFDKIRNHIQVYKATIKHGNDD